MSIANQKLDEYSLSSVKVTNVCEAFVYIADFATSLKHGSCYRKNRLVLNMASSYRCD